MRTNNRSFVLLIAVTGMLATLSLLPSSAAGQAAATTIRTPWGDPDLQGIWSNHHATPLERAKQYGTREFLTKEEIAVEEQRLNEQAKALGRDQRAAAGTERDVQGAYNQFWSGIPIVLRGRRTSMIVDPADGRIPPYTADAKKK